MENVTFRHSRNPIAQNAQGEPTLNEVLQLLQSAERRLAQKEPSLIETSLEVAHEKIENLESKLVSLETELQIQATENRKTAIMHELRSKEFNLLFHGIPMKKNETSATSEKIIRTFISEKLYFCASNLDRIIFSNVHRLPRKTSAISSSTSVTAPSIVVKFLTMKDRTSILNLASHARQIYSITKHLPSAMQINDVLSSKLKINSTKKEANQVENCRHRLQTLFQDRNQGGAGGGEAPP